MRALNLTLTLTVTIAAIPGILEAQQTFKGIVQIFIDLIEFAIIPITILAILAFIWGAARFILEADDSNARTEGRQAMFWGIIGIFVLFSLWGLVRVVMVTFLG